MTPQQLARLALELDQRIPDATLSKNHVGNLAVMSEGAYLGWIDLFQGELNLLNDETERPGGPQLTLDEIWYETHWTDPDGDKSIERFQYDEPLRRAWVKARETFGTVYKCTSWVTREVEQP